MQNKDGKIKFYKHLNFTQKEFRFLIWYKKLKEKMVRGKDTYENGHTNTE